jgi:hypothetical protein
MAIVNLIIMYILRRLLLCYPNFRNIPNSVVFLTDRALYWEYTVCLTIPITLVFFQIRWNKTENFKGFVWRPE